MNANGTAPTTRARALVGSSPRTLAVLSVKASVNFVISFGGAVLEARVQIELAVELGQPTGNFWDNFTNAMGEFIASQPPLPGEVEELLKRTASPF